VVVHGYLAFEMSGLVCWKAIAPGQFHQHTPCMGDSKRLMSILRRCAPCMDAPVSQAHGCAGATLALHHHKRTLHAVQLIFLGSTFYPAHFGGAGPHQVFSKGDVPDITKQHIALLLVLLFEPVQNRRLRLTTTFGRRSLHYRFHRVLIPWQTEVEMSHSDESSHALQSYSKR
jgi:hypothetical protein